MYKTFYGLIVIIWIIDILNIDFIINGIHIVEFLDKTIQLNFWFWLFIWLALPNPCFEGYKIRNIKEK